MPFVNTIPSRLLYYKDRSKKTLTIIPTPSDCLVTLTATNVDQTDNTISVSRGRNVHYLVSKEFYESKSGVERMYADKELHVELIEYPEFTLTINVDPADAVITFDSYEKDRQIAPNQYRVHKDTEVRYTIERIGYVTIERSALMTEDITLNIKMELEYRRFSGTGYSGAVDL